MQLKVTQKQETEKCKRLFQITLSTASIGKSFLTFLFSLGVSGGRGGSWRVPKGL